MVGFFTDINECANDAENPCNVTSNTSWAFTAPLTSMLTTPLMDAAVSGRTGTIDDPVVIEWEWEFLIDLVYAGLFSINLWQESFCRIEAFSDADRTVRVADTRYPNGRDRRVIPGLYDPKSLQPGYPAWLRGGMRNKEFRLYSTNIHANFPLCRARVVRVSLWGGAYRPDGTDDTVYRIGLGWVGDGLLITRHAPGSADGIKSNTELTEMPGGSTWAEPGMRKRTTTIDLALVNEDVRDKLFDAYHRAGNEKPNVILPDIANPGKCFRYGGAFRRMGDHAHKLLPPSFAATTMDFVEWKE